MGEQHLQISLVLLLLHILLPLLYCRRTEIVSVAWSLALVRLLLLRVRPPLP